MKLLYPTVGLLGLCVILAGCSSSSLLAALGAWVAGYAMIRWSAERIKTL